MTMTSTGWANPMAEAETWDLADRIAKDVQDNHMSPPGALGLPELLDKRRLRYGIPDEAFQEQAIFDRIFVWGIEERHQEGKTFGGTRIIKPESTQKRIKHESTRGVLISAGLKALDSLHSHGVALGHIVGVVRLHPWHKTIGMFADSHELYKLVLKDGDLVGSEDLWDRYRSGKVRAQFDSSRGQHVFVDETGKEWDPSDPTLDDSM